MYFLASELYTFTICYFVHFLYLHHGAQVSESAKGPNVGRISCNGALIYLLNDASPFTAKPTKT